MSENSAVTTQNSAWGRDGAHRPLGAPRPARRRIPGVAAAAATEAGPAASLACTRPPPGARPSSASPAVSPPSSRLRAERLARKLHVDVAKVAVTYDGGAAFQDRGQDRTSLLEPAFLHVGHGKVVCAPRTCPDTRARAPRRPRWPRPCAPSCISRIPCRSRICGSPGWLSNSGPQKAPRVAMTPLGSERERAVEPVLGRRGSGQQHHPPMPR